MRAVTGVIDDGRYREKRDIMSKLFINGQWVKGEATQPVINKYTGEPCGEAEVASVEQVAQAVGGVRAGFEKTKLGPYDRYKILMKAAEIVNTRQDVFVPTMIAESGFTKAECTGEFKRCEMPFRISAEEAKRITGEFVPMDATPGLRNRIGYTIRVPRGVVCAITPFNSPLTTIAHKVAPAIAAGNAVILKPAGYTPLTAALFCEVLLDAGLPPSHLALVTGPGSTVGPALINDQRIGFYTFTGSTAVGLEIQRGARLRGVSLELGSISTTIIDESADIKTAVTKVFGAAYRKAGQVCTSTQRVVVHRKVVKEFLDQFLPVVKATTAGDPNTCDIGPMISLADAQRAESWINEAIARGAEILCGGKREGSVLQPTVLHNVTTEMKVVNREIFAPVVSVVEFDDFEWALDYANNTPYGLAVGVFTSNLNHAFRAAERLDFGGIHINNASSARLDIMPFTGVKDSGYGIEGPRNAIREMTEERVVTMAY